jgi:3-oxoacyl-(acyl-carrier-protein) synthase
MDTHSATTLQSMKVISNMILSDRAKVTIAGGFDDLSKEGFYEFGNHSICAPSCGVLSITCEVQSKYLSPFLDINYCAYQIS